MDKPTLLLVHGAWHRKEMWRTLVQHLPYDLDVRTVQLPSSAPVPPSELGDLYDDAATVRAAVEAIGRPTVVVAHSYGGAPVSQGLVGADSVLRLVYLAAFQLDVGESMDSVVGERPYFWGTDHYDEGWYEMTDPVNIFYPDLEPEAAKAAVDALGPHSVASFSQSLTQAAWRTIDSTFILTAKEPGFIYEPLIRRARRVRDIDTGHSPFLSKPAELAGMLMNEIAEAAEGNR